MRIVDEIFQLVEALSLLEANATPGLWHVAECAAGANCWCRSIGNREGSDEMEHCVVPSGAIGKADAAFVVALRNALPRLRELLASWEMPTAAAVQAIVEHATGSKRPWIEYGSVSAIWAAIDQREVDFAVEYQELIKSEKEKGL